MRSGPGAHGSGRAPSLEPSELVAGDVVSRQLDAEAIVPTTAPADAKARSKCSTLMRREAQ